MECTEAEHAKLLIKMLEKKDPCSRCPYPAFENCDFGDLEEDAFCRLCRAFIGLPEYGGIGGQCPCWVLGEKKSIKQTWLALEAGGYLDDKE